jgi:6-pyruvoyl-tetrahydropterin synthase
MKSSIFLADISVVDHAYITDTGTVNGGSFNPGFIVTGNVDNKEKVVVDFSTIKKSIKTSIDKHMHDPKLNGFDHKIWWIEGYSYGSIEKIENTDRYKISTPFVTAELPSDAVKIISIDSFSRTTPSYNVNYIGEMFEKFIASELNVIYPDVNITVSCYNNTNIHLIEQNTPLCTFTYSHGLKDSTSYGCQNILHGHLSFIQLSNEELTVKIANDLNGAVFINCENIINEDEINITIAYTTQRGYFIATYNKVAHNIIVLDTETTIEFIAEYVKNKYNITDFFISEGLSKGTYIA